MRYTETRMAPIAMHLLEGIDEDTVDFADNYSGERQEPTVLPARFPNLLVNGSTGIAVGMATNIPPHNLTEVIDATCTRSIRPMRPLRTCSSCQGPDFPTGAYIVATGHPRGPATGRGSVKMRAVTDIVETKRIAWHHRHRDPVSGVARSRHGEDRRPGAQKKLIAGIADLRDETDRDGTRLVIELKRDANPQVVLNLLFKHTQLEDNFRRQPVALVDGVPRTLNLAEMVGYYIDHQLEVIERRSIPARRQRHGRTSSKACSSPSTTSTRSSRSSRIRGRRAARTTLMERFELSEIQANHILDMPLRRLTALETDKLARSTRTFRPRLKISSRSSTRGQARGLISARNSPSSRTSIGDERRSRIIPDEGDMSLEDLIADEEIVVGLGSGLRQGGARPDLPSPGEGRPWGQGRRSA
jgi:DNA gyrase subunit A